LEGIHNASGIVFCPSNPIVSISPILSIAGVRKAIEAACCPKLAVTPIIAGAPVRGMADKLMPAWDVEVSGRGVARLYAGLIDYFVLDKADARQREDISALGIEPVLASTLMSTREAEISLAQTVVSKLAGRRI
jgi:LPPG:FO 2-phospho-L-lactate transferase